MGTEDLSNPSFSVRLILWLFPLPFVLAGVLGLYIGISNLNSAKRSVNWPHVSGVIREATMEYHSSSEGKGTYEGRIRYEFDLNGNTHSGDRVAFGDYSSSSSSHAQGILNRYPEGKIVTVYYMPGDPDICVLEPGLKAQAWFLPAMGLGFLVAGLLMVVFLPIMASK